MTSAFTASASSLAACFAVTSAFFTSCTFTSACVRSAARSLPVMGTRGWSSPPTEDGPHAELPPHFCGNDSSQSARRASHEPRPRVLACSSSELRIAISDELVQHGVLGVEIEKGFWVESRDRQLDANAAGVYEIAQRAGSTALPRLD